MKTRQSIECRAPGAGSQAAVAGLSRHPSSVTRHACRSGAGRRRAFTLMEILTVIAIIGVVAALIFPVAGAVKRWAFIHTAQAEMSQIETAIERYHSAYGFYPPGSTFNIGNVPISQLYYELVGTTSNPSTGNYVTLDGSATIAAVNVPAVFGANIGGFINCNKPGGDESAPHAQDFLPDLRPTQIAQNITNQAGVPFTLLVTADGGPDPTYTPLNKPDVNPWRYVYPGTNNPGSYDLWVQLQIAGKKYLICNWNNRVQVNNPLP